MNPPCCLFEDDHVLVVNKPAACNTHAPDPWAGEGLYDWLRNREPRWSRLSIVHRLDRETSGVMVFGKSKEANRSLTQQFENRAVSKRYLFLSDKPLPQKTWTMTSVLRRRGDRYESRSGSDASQAAVTRFQALDPVDTNRLATSLGATLSRSIYGGCAVPVTGRTHQIRVHAAENGCPILGDALYGGSPAARLCLHASDLSFRHPVTGQSMTWTAPVDFAVHPASALRTALIDPLETTAYRLLHGASDGLASWALDRVGDYGLLQGEREPVSRELASLIDQLASTSGSFSSLSGIYFKKRTRHVRQIKPQEASPVLIWGTPAPDRFGALENGLRYELSFNEGYSTGLFLDQRDNRRRWLSNYVAPDFPVFADGLRGKTVLNTFAYTCGFSVCAAHSGASVTSLDLSQKYLTWGRRHFECNQLPLQGHDFIFGDAFDWMKRLRKKGRTFDAVILDPPTFSQSKPGGVFRAEQHYAALVDAALPLLKAQGLLLACTNAGKWDAASFLQLLERSTTSAGRRIVTRHFAPQPPDFPITRAEPGHLKTFWLRIEIDS